MIVSIKVMSRSSDLKKTAQGGRIIKTMSTSYSTTLPLDFDREEAWHICDNIISKLFPATNGRYRIATLDGITESFSNNQYCFSIGGDIELIEQADVDVEY